MTDFITTHLAECISRYQSAIPGLADLGKQLQGLSPSTESGTLDALSPLGVLGRGYSICRRLPGLEIVKDAATVTAGAEVEILLHRGRLWCTVKE